MADLDDADLARLAREAHPDATGITVRVWQVRGDNGPFWRAGYTATKRFCSTSTDVPAPTEAAARARLAGHLRDEIAYDAQMSAIRAARKKEVARG